MGKKIFCPNKPNQTATFFPPKTVPTPLPLRTHLSYEQHLTDCGAICPLLHLLQIPGQTEKYNI